MNIKSAVLLLAILEIIALAISITIFWGWFVVPLGVQAINFMQAIGFVSIWSLFKPSSGTDGMDKVRDLEKDSDAFIEQVKKSFSSTMARFFIAWALALIAHFVG